MPDLEHRGLPVAGYKSQSQEGVDMVNGNKIEEEKILRELDHLLEWGGADGRWLAIARTHIELGFMAMNRAIFQPGRVSLPGE